MQPFAVADDLPPLPDAGVQAQQSALSDAEEIQQDAPASPRRRIAAGLVLALAIGWLVAVGWGARASLLSLDAVGLTIFVGAACTVPVLLGITWLILLRTSRAEARRFGATARAMRAEAARLEDTIATVSLHLNENRRALAEQVNALGTLGEVTQQRFSAAGSALAGQIAAAEEQGRRLAAASADAQASAEIVLTSLPRAQASVEEAAQLLDRIGLSAGEHAAALDAQLAALADRGREADTVAGGAARRLAAHIARMEATGETAGVRLEAVTAQATAEVDALLDRTAAAIDGSRQGIAAQGEAMLAMIGAHQAALDAAARDSADALEARIAGVEHAIERLADRLDAQRRAGDTLIDGLQDGIGTVEGRLAALHEQGVDRSQLLAASISALGGSADAMTEALKAGESMAIRTIGTTEALLIALESAAREIDETLPDALTRLDTRIGHSREIVVRAKPELLALVTAAESTHDAIEAIAGVIAEQRRTLDQLSAGLLDTLTQGRAKADALGLMVDGTIERTERFAANAAPRLMSALAQVREAADLAAESARETLSGVLPDAVAELESAASAALGRASSDTVARQLRALSEAADSAVSGSARAVERLSEHLRAITDQTAIVETRLEDVRHEREAAETESFARRSSLLIEQMHSASIDITRQFAPDVSDSAWAAYLKGDRGVFTRRAVRLIDGATAREIARLHDEDARFRETVNRYIHDFEAMLRTVLAQRDGSPMGVTLLSSDIGKLYVALAQAIERLR